MTQQEIRLELIRLINIRPEELLLAEEFINGNNESAIKISEKRKRERCKHLSPVTYIKVSDGVLKL